MERAAGVVVVPIDTEHNVLLVKEYCAGADAFVLSLPGGSIIVGESVEDAAARELREETGFTAQRMIKLSYAYTHPSTTNRKSYTFLGYDLKLDSSGKTEELIETVKMPLEDALRYAYEDFQTDVTTVGNLLMAQNKLKQLNL